VGRDPTRPADVFVEPSRAEPATARAVPKPRVRIGLPATSPLSPPTSTSTSSSDDPPASSIPSSTTQALEPLDEALETVHTGELILEEYGAEERTPPTPVAPWQRLIPPPLPEKG